MATNKHATIRYQALDKCFRNPGRRYYIEDLIEACNNALFKYTGSDSGVKRRQIFEDIKFMESSQGWNIPLEKCRDGHRVYYRYEDSSFSVNNQPLNESEESQLKEALLTLSRFKGMPQFEWVDEITARLDAGLGLSHNQKNIIEFEQNNYLKGLEFITPLYNAILYEKPISILYKSFRQLEQQRIEFHPYFLKQYNNRWYVFGLNGESRYIMNLALDRIIGLDNLNIDYIENDSIDFNEYFEDIVGVTLNNEVGVQNIILQVQNSLYPYIETKPIHGSQKRVKSENSYTIISLDLIPNYELESLILSFGEGIEVIEPYDFRDKIADRIYQMNKRYSY